MSVLFILFCAASFGCAAAPEVREVKATPAMVKDNYIITQISEYRYDQEFDTVWAKAGALLLRHGYSVYMSDDNSVIKTYWADDGSDDKRRYVVTADISDDGKAAVRYEYQTKNSDDEVSKTYTRDFWMEYALLKSVDRDRWNAINTNADVYVNMNFK